MYKFSTVKFGFAAETGTSPRGNYPTPCTAMRSSVVHLAMVVKIFTFLASTVRLLRRTDTRRNDVN
jgi:hypothetical protein